MSSVGSATSAYLVSRWRLELDEGGSTNHDRRGGGDGDASRHRQERPQPRLRHHLCDYDLTEWDLYCGTACTHRGQRGGGDGGAECPRRGRQHHQRRLYNTIRTWFCSSRKPFLLTATNVVVVTVAPDVLSGVGDSLGLICLGRNM